MIFTLRYTRVLKTSPLCLTTGSCCSLLVFSLEAFLELLSRRLHSLHHWHPPMTSSTGSEASSSAVERDHTDVDSSSASEDSSEEELPKVELPNRSTRGSRHRGLVEEEDSADEDFWKQDFFAEEARDEKYHTESESEDVADTDFSESEVRCVKYHTKRPLLKSVKQVLSSGRVSLRSRRRES